MANRKATITVDWPIANLQAKLDVEAPGIRKEFSFSIPTFINNTSDGGYPFIPSGDTSVYYPLEITDDLGTTAAEWVQKFNAGYLTFSRQSSYVSIVVYNGVLCFKMDTQGSGAILERYITARIRNDGHGSDLSYTFYYRHPPFGSTLTCRYFGDRQTTSAPEFTEYFRMARVVIGFTTSSISGSDSYLLYINGLITVSSGSIFATGHTDDDQEIYIQNTTDSTSSSFTLTYGWNGLTQTSKSITVANWIPVSGSDYFYLRIVDSTLRPINSDSTSYKQITTTWNESTALPAVNGSVTYGADLSEGDVSSMYYGYTVSNGTSWAGYFTLSVRDTRMKAIDLYNLFNDACQSSNTNSADTRLSQMNGYICLRNTANDAGTSALFSGRLGYSRGFASGYYTDINSVVIGSNCNTSSSSGSDSGFSYSAMYNGSTRDSGPSGSYITFGNVNDYLRICFYIRANKEYSTSNPIRYFYSNAVKLDWSGQGASNRDIAWTCYTGTTEQCLYNLPINTTV